MTNRKRITHRTIERISRAAYEYEHLASVARSEGHEFLADSLNQIASCLGSLGRNSRIDEVQS